MTAAPDAREPDPASEPGTSTSGPGTGSSEPGTGSRRARRRGHGGPGADRPGRHRRRWPWVVVAVVVVLLALAGWLAWRGLQVVRALEGAVPAVSAIQEDLRSGDVDAATARLPALSEGAADARAATADPVWRAASHLPWVGAQLRAVSDVVRAFDRVATDVVPALTEVGEAADPAALTAAEGRIDLAPLVAAAPRLEEAGAAAEDALAILRAIDTEPLVEPLAVRVVEATDALAEASGTLGAARTAARLVPPMLGAEGPRTYLVLVLNPAELRSGGGIVGALAELTASDGAITLTGQRPAAAIPSTDEPVLPLSDAEVAVHTDQLGRAVQNATMTPHAPRAAELAAAFWERETGTAVDGVLALDPVALGYLLRATGPLEVPGGPTLDEGNAARVLLHEAYGLYPDPDATDAFFAGAAAAVFSAVAGGQGDLGAQLPAVRQAAEEGRLTLWSRHADEQELLGPSVVGGAFLGEDAPQDAVGVFLDDVTATKLGWFLRSDVEVVCGPGGDGGAVVRVTLRSTVPDDVASLPRYVTTSNRGEEPTGRLVTNVTVYGPVGGGLGAAERDGRAVGTRRAEEAGRPALVLTSTLEPGASETYEIAVDLPPDVAAVPLRTTPTVEGSGRTGPVTCG